MHQSTKAHNTLFAAGFDFSLELGGIAYPLCAVEGGCSASTDVEFEEMHTGGGCLALRRSMGGLFMLITDEDGSNLPDMQDWKENMIGVYREADDEEVVVLTPLQWMQVKEIEAKRCSSTPS